MLKSDKLRLKMKACLHLEAEATIEKQYETRCINKHSEDKDTIQKQDNRKNKSDHT